VREHIRSNMVGYVALFLALNAGAYAATAPRQPGNSPRLSGDTTVLQQRVTGKCDPGEAIRIVQRKGTVVCQPVASQSGGAEGASGPAGGDLTGTYPNPQIAPGAVGSAEIAPAAIDSPGLFADALKDGSAGTPTLRSLGNGANQAVAGNDSRIPSQAENDALQGTNGNPSGSNRYVTDSDPRLSDSRTPSGPAGGDLSGNYPNPTISQGAAYEGYSGVAQVTGPLFADVTFDVDVISNGFAHTPGTSPVTVTTQGRFLVQGMVRYSAAITGDFTLQLLVDGGAVPFGDRTVTAEAGISDQVELTALVDLVPGNVLTLQTQGPIGSVIAPVPPSSPSAQLVVTQVR
jgi:hypothetical protein